MENFISTFIGYNLKIGFMIKQYDIVNFMKQKTNILKRISFS